MEKLKVIIVEDSPEVIEAAKKYFDTRDEYGVDFFNNFEEAKKALLSYPYAFAIFDLNFPRKKGQTPKELGFELADIARRAGVYWVILSSGTDHHGCEGTFTCFCDSSRYPWGRRGEVREIPPYPPYVGTEKSKKDPETWKEIFELLESLHPEAKRLLKKERRVIFLGEQCVPGLNLFAIIGNRVIFSTKWNEVFSAHVSEKVNCYIRTTGDHCFILKKVGNKWIEIEVEN